MAHSPTSAEAFASFLAENRGAVDARLGAGFRAPVGACADDLRRYLYGPLADFSANGGKRTRPLVCLLGCRAVGGDPAAAMTVACAIENFQSAALIHDDIADGGELRRGKPCLHLVEGVGVATNCGDLALCSVTGDVVDDAALDPETKLRVLHELSAMTVRTIEGQALDLGWARDARWDVTPEDYLAMATLKTAHYSGAVPLACGAIVGGGSDSQVEALRAFGMDTGLSFQLQDDLLNLVGDATSQGKDFRSDITEGKRTLLVVWALAHLPAEGRDELVGILSSHATGAAELARAVDLIAGSGAIDRTRSYAGELAGRAKASLGKVELEDGSRDVLLSMADFFVERLG